MLYWLRQKLGRPSKEDLNRDRRYQRSDAVLVFMDKVLVYQKKTDTYRLKNPKLHYHDMDRIVREIIGAGL